MEEFELIKKWKTSKIIKKIEKNKLNISIEEILMVAINSNRNDLVTYILNNQEYAKDYTNDFGFDYLSVAVSSGNLDAIDLLYNNGFNINKKYKFGKKLVTAVYYVRNLEILKHLEKYIEEKDIRIGLESVIRTTLMSHDVELLDYILNKYKINLKRIKYDIKNKKYNILELTEEMLQSMRSREYRKREFAFYITELLPNKRYRKIEKRAYEILNNIEKENEEIERYYKYLKKKIGVKK